MLHIIEHKRSENYLNLAILVSSERLHVSLSIHISFISIVSSSWEIAAKEIQVSVQLPDILAESLLRLRYTGPFPQRLPHIFEHKRFENYLNPPILLSSEEPQFPLSICISFISLFGVVREISSKGMQIRVQLADIFAEFWLRLHHTGHYPAPENASYIRA